MFKRLFSSRLAGAVALAATLCASAATASAHNLRIDNQGSHTIMNVYVAPTSWTTYGDDRLFGLMYPNQYLDLTLSDDYCHFDIKLVYTNYQVWRSNNFDTCTDDLTVYY